MFKIHDYIKITFREAFSEDINTMIAHVHMVTYQCVVIMFYDDSALRTKIIFNECIIEWKPMYNKYHSVRMKYNKGDKMEVGYDLVPDNRKRYAHT